MHLLPLGEAEAEWAEERPARELTSLGVWAFMGEKFGRLNPDPEDASEWTGRLPGRGTCPGVRPEEASAHALVGHFLTWSLIRGSFFAASLVSLFNPYAVDGSFSYLSLLFLVQAVGL